MKMIIGIVAAATVVIAGLWYQKAKAQARVEPPKTVYNKEEAEKFVRKLDELGYFKYADSSDLDSLKKNMVVNYDPDSELISIWDDKTGTPKDYRYYFCDGETVYEEGGITELLENLKPSFARMNFKCEVTSHFEEWNQKNKWLNHRIGINGNEYIIFKNFPERGWGEAPRRIAEILNIELSKQGKNEKVYLVSGANDGRLIFLTDELYQYIYSVYKNPGWKPLELEEWARVMGVKPMKMD